MSQVLLPNSAKIHLRASATSKSFPGLYHGPMLNRAMEQGREGGRGEDGEYMEVVKIRG
jgi:hypothetical protein